MSDDANVGYLIEPFQSTWSIAAVEADRIEVKSGSCAHFLGLLAARIVSWGRPSSKRARSEQARVGLTGSGVQGYPRFMWITQLPRPPASRQPSRLLHHTGTSCGEQQTSPADVCRPAVAGRCGRGSSVVRNAMARPLPRPRRADSGHGPGARHDCCHSERGRFRADRRSDTQSLERFLKTGQGLGVFPNFATALMNKKISCITLDLIVCRRNTQEI